MTRRLTIPCGALSVAVLFLVGVPLPAIGGPELISHRGVYGLKLGAVKQGGAYVDARGALNMVIEKTCDGWVLAQDMAMELDTVQGGQVRQAVRFTGWESLDGLHYRFVARTQTGSERRDSRGEAHIEAVGKAGEVTFQAPEATKMTLPAGTRFPVTHSIWLIERALAGDNQAPSVVFDGSDGEGPQQVTAFIGRRLEPSEHSKTTLGPLAEHVGWNMRLAFFPTDSRTASPEYEMEVLQLINGVAPRLVLDYRDFTVVLDIKKIEPLPTPTCK
jgi:hypothetical protein